MCACRKLDENLVFVGIFGRKSVLLIEKGIYIFAPA